MSVLHAICYVQLATTVLPAPPSHFCCARQSREQWPAWPPEQHHLTRPTLFRRPFLAAKATLQNATVQQFGVRCEHPVLRWRQRQHQPCPLERICCVQRYRLQAPTEYANVAYCAEEKRRQQDLCRSVILSLGVSFGRERARREAQVYLGHAQEERDSHLGVSFCAAAVAAEA